MHCFHKQRMDDSWQGTLMFTEKTSIPFPFNLNGIWKNGNPFGSKSKGSCHHDHIPLILKGKGNIVFSVYDTT